MSMLITVKVRGDIAKFRSALVERADEFEKMSDAARNHGALHHRFATTEEFALAVDEWESVEGFQSFFGDPAMQEFIASIGGDTSSPPEITVAESIPDAAGTF